MVGVATQRAAEWPGRVAANGDTRQDRALVWQHGDWSQSEICAGAPRAPRHWSATLIGPLTSSPHRETSVTSDSFVTTGPPIIYQQRKPRFEVFQIIWFYLRLVWCDCEASHWALSITFLLIITAIRFLLALRQNWPENWRRKPQYKWWYATQIIQM